MTITHHPDHATLMSFAAGSLPEPLSAVVASHAAVCPACRADIALLETLGGALVSRLENAQVDRDPPRLVPDAVSEPRQVAASRSSAEVPAPIAAIVGTDLDAVRWKRLAPGIWHHRLPLSRGVTGDLRLFKVAPGQTMPDHGHGGAEMMLMLRGSYSDCFGTFRPGDVADLDEDCEHQPVSDPDVGCICLIAAVGKARYKSLLARLVQPFTGI
ncbi:MAG: ChrR family anti-sigma-E factor [Hyphomicrobiaceae bacterium]